MNSKSMNQYYVATEDGKTEGPLSRYDLMMKYARGEINKKTLVCPENEQDWVPFELISKKEQEGSQISKSDDSNSQVAGAFRGVGIVCFVLALVIPLLLLAGKNSQPVFAAALFLVLALSGLGWLGVGVIIRLLEQIAENTRKR